MFPITGIKSHYLHFLQGSIIAVNTSSLSWRLRGHRYIYVCILIDLLNILLIVWVPRLSTVRLSRALSSIPGLLPLDVSSLLSRWQVTMSPDYDRCPLWQFGEWKLPRLSTTELPLPVLSLTGHSEGTRQHHCIGHSAAPHANTLCVLSSTQGICGCHRGEPRGSSRLTEAIPTVTSCQ